MEDNWNFSQIWNELLTKERAKKPRAFIRASEIGKPFLDRYLTMKGVPYSNPFEARILRVFDVGNIFEVSVMERMFRLLGLYISSQKELTLQKPGLLPVVGHHDPIVGGKIDLPKVKKLLSLPFLRKMKKINTLINPLYGEVIRSGRIEPWMLNRAKALAIELHKHHPNGMRKLLSEFKTVNSRVFWSKKNQDPTTGFFRGYDHHKLQGLTYLMASGMPECRLFYISKDDMTVMESSIFADDKHLLDLWHEDISKMTEIYNSGKEPEHEPYIVYNEIDGMYEPNWKIERSNYFTYITGFATTKEWYGSIKDELNKKNSAECGICKKVYQLKTLNKYNGLCGKCYKGVALKIAKGGEEVK